MKQLASLQQQTRRTNSNTISDNNNTSIPKSPTTIFFLILHAFCCLISLLLGFRFSRLIFFLLFSPTSNTSPFPPSPTFQTPVPKNASRVIVGRHGILIRPWPHPDPTEVIKAHKIIQRVQSEQRSQYGVKNFKTVIAVTPTYVRTFQTLHLSGVMHSLMNVGSEVVWIVVEAGGTSNETAGLVGKSGLNVVHVGFGREGMRMPVLWEERHRLESRMRLHALRIIREKKLDGIVMFADDSNMHSLELFDEIQNVKWVGAVSVGILAHSIGSSEEVESTMAESDNSKKDLGKSEIPVQGPACNSSNHLVGWHTFNTLPFVERSARYIGDRAAVLPTKLEWAGFVLNSRLLWEDRGEELDWVKDFDEVLRYEEDVENPLSLLKDASMVEPLGSCGRKVMLWWLRVEARADSKFPARWIIDPPLDITVPAKHTPWPDAPPELPSVIERVEKVINIPENTDKRATKGGARRKRRSKKKHTPKVLDELSSIRQSRDT